MTFLAAASARLTAPRSKTGLALAVAALLGANAAHAEDLLTTEIPGVVAAGTRIELLKEDLKGTEGPIASPDGGLLFTENQAGRILKIAADGSFSVFSEQNNSSNALAYTPRGDLVSVQTAQTRVGVIQPAGHEKTLAEGFEGLPFGRPNDLVADKRGGIYFTDSGANANQPQPVSDKTPAKPAVYYITAKGELKRLANDIQRPNGIQLSPDEKVLYVANTPGEHVLAYDVAKDGTVSNRRDFARLVGWRKGENDSWSSGADGLAVDADGRLYVATNAGVEVFTAEGKTLGVIQLPKKPQNLAFAGADKKTLYIVGRGSVYRLPTLASGYRGRVK